ISTSSTYTMQRVATNDITLTATYELAPDDEPENEGSSNNNVALAIALACRNNKKCVVTYKSTGANDHVSATVKKGTALAMPAAPTKDGYTFVGWYKDINGTKPFDFNAKITGSVSIYAKWVKN
ncbi:MAG: InlB B-repeat-containing protein, partial [Clostridia bacterium]|nr:InlB B-repeat-containing protein [Clostridia bacterium]